jgi:UPF0176 protein
MDVHVTSFYRFLPLGEGKVSEIKNRLEMFSLESGILGLCLLGREGINSTMSGSSDAIASLKTLLRELISPEMSFKDSLTTRHPFHIFRIKIKDEIVTMGKPGFAPDSAHNFHLSPEEWHLALQNPEAVILDTRNDYEVEIGKFRGARDFALKEFSEFPEAVRSSGIAKDKPVLMYCTGGIRCEKAMLEMRSQGFTNVHQLEGGILNYIEKFPEAAFEGECFVFDYRVAVDQDLQPTVKYKLCPHCGQPANKPITCAKCGTGAIVCHHCENEFAVTCSKNCAHHMSIGSASKRAHKQELTKRHKI